MHTGQSYWVISINSYKLEKQNLPKPEYFKLVKQLRFDLKHYSKGKLEFQTEDAATEAFKKLPEFIQKVATINYTTPIYGIL